MTLLIVLALVAAGLLYAVIAYNRFVSLKMRVDEAWSDIQVQMKLRYNLVPNLVETVKGYAGHEARVLQSVTDARTEAMADDGGPEQQSRSENMLVGALRMLFALAEDYPDLKANENFTQLQSELAAIEDRIQAARRFYNGNVRNNNIKVDQFPSNLIARLFGFAHAEFFELDASDASDASDAAARRPVPVDFGRPA